MGLFRNNKNGGIIADIIRCDEPSYLVWKWSPMGEHESRRENSIRWGSTLRVKDGEVAVFVYKQDDGTMQDFIVGPFDETIQTKNFPVLSAILGLGYNGESPFQAEVYFINLARLIQVKFAVPFFDVYDPRFLDFGVPVAVRGTISFCIKDCYEFVKLHRLSEFNLEAFQKQIRDSVARYVKSAVANAPMLYSIPVVQLETKTNQINEAVEHDISERLSRDFGVCVSGVDIGSIEIDKASEGYSQLMEVTKKVDAVKISAQTEDYIERLRIQREESQYAMHKQAQSSNIGAFQLEKQTEVGIAGANALGHMGENGAGSINLNGAGGGFNPAAMMTGIALGGAVGQNIAGTMNGIMGGMNNAVPGAVPPPIPSVVYYVAVNGKPAGPYDINTLAQMAVAGQFAPCSLIWKNGMAQWAKADTVEELSSVFTSIPSVPPVE